MNSKSNKLTGLKNKSDLPLLTLLLAGAMLSGPGWGTHALAYQYTVNCPVGFSTIALQVYNGTNSVPLAGGEDLNTVLTNLNTGVADGCLLYTFATHDGSAPRVTIFIVDSASPTGWDDANTGAPVPPPHMHVGDGAFFFNNSGASLPLTFSGNVLRKR
jgi:hypothetical protein